MADTFVGIITADGKKRQLPYGSVLETPVSDATLSVQGAFADAKAVGDKFAETDDKITQVKSDLASETSRATAAENTKADKTALARTDRSLDALWKLNSGVSYEFQKDETVAYQKNIPTGTKLASVEKIGGKTLVWNQMIQNGDFSLNSMWSGLGSTVSVEGNTGIFTATEAALTNNKIEVYQILSGDVVKGHKYCARFEYNLSVDINDQSTLNLNNIFTKIPVVGAGTWGKFNSIVTVNVVNNVVNDIFDLYFFFDSLSVGDTVKLRNVQLFDLTRMFGPGNEPSTPEEFEAMFPADYYPYNEGELLSTPVNEVVEQGKNLFEKKTIDIEVDKNQIFSNRYYPKGTYTIKFHGSSNGSMILYGVKKNGELIKLIEDRYEDSYKKGKTFTLNEECVCLRYYSNIKVDEAVFQIERGSTPTAYEPYHEISYPISQSILQLDGYGDGVTADVYNYIDWENKKYHKRVGKVDLSKLNCETYGTQNEWDSTGFVKIVCLYNGDWTLNNSDKNVCLTAINSYGIVAGGVGTSTSANVICLYVDGSIYISMEQSIVGNTAEQFINYIKQHKCILYYELAEEQIIDISDLIGDTLQEPIEVETGGSLTFRNTHGDNYRVSVPNTVEYTVKLSEVAG